MHVHDGDTLTLLTSQHQKLKIRLADIDAPELNQPYGESSQQLLNLFVFNKSVTVTSDTRDRYGRTIGRITRAQDGLDINAAMINLGAAWVYRHYARDKFTLLRIETTARQASRGLWSLQTADRIPPWQWRRGQYRSRTS